MKAILVMTMPKCCAECSLMLWDAESEYYGACCPTLKEVNSVADSYKENENKGTKPNWCPLKPMPQPKGYIDAIEWHLTKKDSAMFTDGWNACLEALEDLHNGEDSNE